MYDKVQDAKNFLGLAVMGLIVIIFFFTLIIPSPEAITVANSLFTQWVPSIFLGLIISAISAGFVEGLTGDSLKYIYLSFNIKGIKVSITLFAIATLIVKFILFP